MKQIKRADLHMHSTFSDGVEEPEELVIRAKNNGVELISLTDHDETGGLERMKAAAAQHGLQFANACTIPTASTSTLPSWAATRSPCSATALCRWLSAGTSLSS